MKARGLKKDKVNIVTLGCSKNLVDSEVMLTQLKGNGINTTHEAQKDDANVIMLAISARLPRIFIPLSKALIPF